MQIYWTILDISIIKKSPEEINLRDSFYTTQGRAYPLRHSCKPGTNEEET